MLYSTNQPPHTDTTPQVARELRKKHEKQPSLMFVLQAPGPQSFLGDLDDEDDEDGPMFGQPSARSQDAVPLSEEPSNEVLYEHLVTLERGCLPVKTRGGDDVFFFFLFPCLDVESLNC
jgi:hypothetical protein